MNPIEYSKREDRRATGHLHLRIARDRKTSYVRAAQSKRQTLAAWVFTHLDKASGYEA